MRLRIRPLVILGLTLAAAAARLETAPAAHAADVRLARLFADHAVLQRDRPVRVWGWAAPGARVVAGIGGVAVPTAAGADGRWETVLPPFPAGGPRDLTVESGGGTVIVRDVLFGDVWVASGQSNMEWTLGSGVKDGAREIAAADHPGIRFFTVPRVVSPRPEPDLSSGEWRICSPETAPGMSAVAYFFARDLHREKGVPIGIVDATWGGTPAEAWTSAGMNLFLPGYRDRMRSVLEPGRDWTREMAENDARGQARWKQIRDLEGAKAGGAHRRGFDDRSWATVRLPNETPLSDFVWLRRTVAIAKPERSGYRMRLGTFENVDAVFVNGTEVYRRGGTEQVREVSLPEGVLTPGENVLAIRALNDWNNEVRVGRPGPMDLRHDGGGPVVPLDGEWRFSNAVEPKMPRYVRYSHTPSFLYNAMIAPIAGFTLKGAIWYQGESNAGEAHAYRSLFPAMIQDWRVRWREGSWPFLFVQLAGWRERKPEPAPSDWAELREAQLMTLALPDTGMAVTIDIGEADDIHPRNKQDVGRRLALAARKVAYGDAVIHSGPLYRSMEVRGSEVVLSFDHVGGGLMARDGTELVGFAVAGEDRRFAWARARVEGDRVVVRSDLVGAPVAVRYAWADNPDCNLVNREGLPASPFRTDAWPGVTE